VIDDGAKSPVSKMSSYEKNSAVEAWQNFCAGANIEPGRVVLRTAETPLSAWFVKQVNKAYCSSTFTLVLTDWYVLFEHRGMSGCDLRLARQKPKGTMGFTQSIRTPISGWASWLTNSLYGRTETHLEVCDTLVYYFCRLYSAQTITGQTQYTFYAKCDQWYQRSAIRQLGRFKYLAASKAAAWEAMSEQSVVAATLTKEGRMSFIQSFGKWLGITCAAASALCTALFGGNAAQWADVAAAWGWCKARAEHIWKEASRRLWRYVRVTSVFWSEEEVLDWMDGEKEIEEFVQCVERPIYSQTAFEDRPLTEDLAFSLANGDSVARVPIDQIDIQSVAEDKGLLFWKYAGIPWVNPPRNMMGALSRYGKKLPRAAPGDQMQKCLNDIFGAMANAFQTEGCYDPPVDSKLWKDYYHEHIKPTRDGSKVMRDALYILRQTEATYSGCSEPSSEVDELFRSVFGSSIKDVPGISKNPDMHSKTDEVLLPKVRESSELCTVYIKGRPIVAVSPHTYLKCVIPVREVYKALTSEVLEFKVNGWVVFLQIGPSDVEALSSIYDKFSTYKAEKWVFINQSGDDCIAFGSECGRYFSFENDFSSFDQTERCGIMHQEMLLFFSHYFTEEVIARWYSNFGGVWGRLVQAIVKLMMATGNPVTSLWNSAWGAVFIIAVVCVSGPTKSSVEYWDEQLGMVSKPKFLYGSKLFDVMTGTTFLKGWWLPNRGGGLTWTPLPSRLLKLFKMDPLNNPTCLDGDPCILLARSYQMCLGLEYYSLDPVLSQVVSNFINAFETEYPARARKMLKGVSAAHEAGKPVVKPYWVEPGDWMDPAYRDGDGNLLDIDERSFHTMFRRRYQCDPPAPTTLFAVYGNLEPVIVSNPSIRRMAHVDYC
jgi:hypothetical protein